MMISKAQSLLQQLEYIQDIEEVAPPGFEGTILAMKKRHAKEIDNPWALAWYLRNKGAKSHYTKTGKKKRES